MEINFGIATAVERDFRVAIERTKHFAARRIERETIRPQRHRGRRERLRDRRVIRSEASRRRERTRRIECFGIKPRVRNIACTTFVVG